MISCDHSCRVCQGRNTRAILSLFYKLLPPGFGLYNAFELPRSLSIPTPDAQHFISHTKSINEYWARFDVADDFMMKGLGRRFTTMDFRRPQ